MDVQSVPNNIAIARHAEKERRRRAEYVKRNSGPSDTEVSGAQVLTAGGAAQAIQARSCWQSRQQHSARGDQVFGGEIPDPYATETVLVAGP